MIRQTTVVIVLLGVVLLATPMFAHDQAIPEDPETKLLMTGDWEIVKKVCTRCHSAKMITQARLSRDRWEELVRWMQKTQGLQDLGDDEETILDYLGSYYPAPGELAASFPKDTDSGLIMGHGWTTVRAVCSACHSLKLVIQNRGDRDTWLERIRWMQKTQGLWKLGMQEKVILDYLAEFYGVSKRRRIPGLPASLQPR